MGAGPKSEYIVFVEGEDKMAEKMSKLLAVSLGNIKGLYDDGFAVVTLNDAESGSETTYILNKNGKRVFECDGVQASVRYGEIK